ncbi:Na+/H+ antiporter subunit G [Octadecabacter sp.]|jgi:multicomponent K+:H+ antiporter subunit G|nr:Na+/H+ antiporter subunit G [Octadecabacter sp.]MDC1230925.1 Na+/H+ antiporter subunit G [Octadecabacter sp.]MDC1297080.1 Na+/H+ antiporter subunit G [Octadecabacter sp.]MDC1380108.1 Na+/H+ antiporter subunit G [Octadecabacter sp.]MDC1397454.1 Na+/H+ antiporter subunit G [Octadecabacter sp.]|tara:strand:+ start:1164 stop:1553 length:390 start_codon:yes stop_codon:yes gene_type:complete
MTITDIASYAIGVFLLIGAFFSLVGSIGMLKLPDSMTRLHAPTKVGTMGIGALLLASMTYAYTFGDGSLREILIMAFLFVTAPISANFMSKVNIHRKSCEIPPEAPQDQVWSTLVKRDEDAAQKDLKTL